MNSTSSLLPLKVSEISFFYSWDFNYDPIIHSYPRTALVDLPWTYSIITFTSPREPFSLILSLLCFSSLCSNFFNYIPFLLLQWWSKQDIYTQPHFPILQNSWRFSLGYHFFFLFLFLEGGGGFVIWLSSIDQGSTTEVRELAHQRRSYKPPHCWRSCAPLSSQTEADSYSSGTGSNSLTTRKARTKRQSSWIWVNWSLE